MGVFTTGAGVHRFTACFAVFLLAGLLAAAGCSKPPDKDPFFDHWSEKAANSQGYSPSAGPKNLAAQAKPIESAQKTRVSETMLSSKPVVVDLGKEKKLPAKRVSLKMYNTDLVAVLRALARAADQNIVVSSSIKPVDAQAKGQGDGAGGQGGSGAQGGPGNTGDAPARSPDDKARSVLVNINITDAPWNEAFESILHANGLTYTWEGDIIRVVTLEDLENDQKMKEAQEKILVQKEKLKLGDPLVTCKVEINYADLGDVLETVRAFLDPTRKIRERPKLESIQRSTSSGSSGTGGTVVMTTTQDKSKDDEGGKQEDEKKVGRPGKVRGYVTPDYHTNSLIIQASREDMDRLLKLVEQLDEPRPQVLVKAFIIETTKEVARELGIQWGGQLQSGSGNTPFSMSPGGYYYTEDGTVGSLLPYYGTSPSGQGFGINFPTTGSLTSAASTAASGLGSQGMGLNFLFGNIDGNYLEAQLTALAEKGKVNILSNPSITTLENRVAYTWNGRQVPYVSSSQYGTNVQFRNAVLLLGMVPHIIDGTRLRMDILVTNDEVDNNQNNWVQGNPPLITKETRTTLIVGDGDTIVISGLTKDTVSDTASGIPYLKDIPGLGYLFKAKGDSVSKQEVLIFITPSVLKQRPMAMAPRPGAAELEAKSAPVMPSDGVNLEMRPGF
ncbi:secretin N-terminal domain-containing protein [Desulfolutivibrio sulfoxidireducens]|uniref:secretin N-terminal domain-containing protein n=1 Tax=Desulfolutivibrio sulfoxidireducens TaxID=2773299 RepID=UPI00159E661C|nr:secretin N-terminal domain-containing protein [Desulfolutivibrio sulfoxidireducens]QLA19366.1 type II and III secretion system protein [Desulfolutivibrio sulfoxidireducens]